VIGTCVQDGQQQNAMTSIDMVSRQWQ